MSSVTACTYSISYVICTEHNMDHVVSGKRITGISRSNSVKDHFYIFNGFSRATLEISYLISQSQSHDLSFANINELPYVGCGRFYPVKELSGCPDIV